MASEKAAMILRSKSKFTAEEIEQMPDAEAWAWIYSHVEKPKRAPQREEVCFTGFLPDDRERLERLASEIGLHVVTAVTKNLRYLVTGAVPGPVKVEKAQAKGVSIITEHEFNCLAAQ